MIPASLVEQLASQTSLSRWERAELGRDLRRLGLSYGEISDLLPAAKSTIARWCRGIELTDAQRAAIVSRTGSKAGIPVHTQWRRRETLGQISADARAELPELVRNPFWTAGTLLYWGEGTKGGNRVAMTNSDAELLRLFMRWVGVFLSPDAVFAASIILHAANDVDAAEQWWSDELSIPRSDFNKPYVKPDGTGQRKNHLPHGVCQLRMRRSSDQLHKVLAWIDGLRAMTDLAEALSSRPGR